MPSLLIASRLELFRVLSKIDYCPIHAQVAEFSASFRVRQFLSRGKTHSMRTVIVRDAQLVVEPLVGNVPPQGPCRRDSPQRLPRDHCSCWTSGRQKTDDSACSSLCLLTPSLSVGRPRARCHSRRACPRGPCSARAPAPRTWLRRARARACSGGCTGGSRETRSHTGSGKCRKHAATGS